MDLSHLNRVCFAVCIVCIVIGMVLALKMVWGPSNSAMWKEWISVGIVFFSSILALIVSKTYGRKDSI